MRKIHFLAFFFWLVNGNTQTVSSRLATAFKQFENDIQLKHAISSLYVIDAQTGRVLFDKNAQIGLAPASTQKIITAVTAFELLGADYRYKTQLGYTSETQGGVPKQKLVIHGNGDPTLGSPRWKSTTDTVLLNEWTNDIKKTGIRKFDEVLIKSDVFYSASKIPDGWIWQDIGNYYGAAADIINWQENQYDIVLKSSGIRGEPVEIISPGKEYLNELKSASRESGDNAYVYYNNVITGTIPVAQKAFKISASTHDPAVDLLSQLTVTLASNGISLPGKKAVDAGWSRQNAFFRDSIISTHYSPTLDLLIYWFLQKSINLYGEALIKTLAVTGNGYADTNAGATAIKNFWKQKGIDTAELNISDGSGLSPQNRITTHAQVEILKYARKRTWFDSFYKALPGYNGMKMKSGTIKDVKGFCGYHKAGNGKEYIFSFLVNNYSGTSSDLVGKMYRVLNVLK